METHAQDGHARHIGRHRRTALAVGLVALAIGMLALQAAPATGAVFTSTGASTGTASTGRIFPGHRVTAAVTITDSSSGATVDRSIAIAFAGDGRWTLGHPWATAFVPGQVLDVVLGHPLPAGLDVPTAQLAVTLAGDDAGATACWYVEIVRTSTEAPVASAGSAVSPLACTVGTTPARTVVPLPAVTRSDLANDLTIRIHGRNTTGAAPRIDEVVVSGATPYAPFTLYPVLTRDASDGHAETLPLSPAGE